MSDIYDVDQIGPFREACAACTLQNACEAFQALAGNIWADDLEIVEDLETGNKLITQDSWDEACPSYPFEFVIGTLATTYSEFGDDDDIEPDARDPLTTVVVYETEDGPKFGAITIANNCPALESAKKGERVVGHQLKENLVEI